VDELKAFSPSLRFFIELSGGIKSGVILQYFFIVILAVIVYRLGFAKKLPLLKNIIIYSCLAIGCLLLLVFSYGLPIAEGLAVAAIVLIIYKIRLRQTNKQETEAK
jgi:hypothetical protein